MEHALPAYHAVEATDRPRLGFQLPPEKFTQVSVVVKIFYSCLLHIDTERPDVQAEDRFAEPSGQFNIVQAPPGSGE